MMKGNVKIKTGPNLSGETIIEIDGTPVEFCSGLTFSQSVGTVARLHLDLVVSTCDIDADGVQINGLPTDDDSARLIYGLLKRYFDGPEFPGS